MSDLQKALEAEVERMRNDDFMGHYPIVIVEGPDRSGKSTLLSQLMQKHPNNVYIHNAVVPDIQELHCNALMAALKASKTHYVFIDRLHLSEEIYGAVFRDGPSYDTKSFDRIVNSIPFAKKILCYIDKDTTLKLHEKNKADEMFDTIDKVYDLYGEADSSWTRYSWKTDIIDLSSIEVKHGDKTI